MLKQHWKASNVIVQANHHGPEKHGRGCRTWLENRLQNIARMTRKPLLEVTHAKPHAFVCIHGNVTGNPWKSIEISYESVQSLDTVQFVRLSKSEPSRPSFEVRLVQRLDRWLSLGQGQLTWKSKEPLRNRFGTALERGWNRTNRLAFWLFRFLFPAAGPQRGQNLGQEMPRCSWSRCRQPEPWTSSSVSNRTWPCPQTRQTRSLPNVTMTEWLCINMCKWYVTL